VSDIEIIKKALLNPDKNILNITVDFSNANPEAHNYAVDKLKEKFGEHGKCTMLDYAEFYGEKLIEMEKEEKKNE